MTNEIEFEGKIKHDETNFPGGKIGIWLINHTRSGFFDWILNKLPGTRPWQHIALPAEYEDVARWKYGDRVRITVENLEGDIE